MKNFLFAFLFIFSSMTVWAQDADRDQSESPYFIVKSEASETESLPLLSTQAEVNIAGVIADVQVTQTYVNRGESPIEAVYVFPGSTNAAVYGMTMKVGNRLIKAKIKEKKQARQEYEAAKSEGKRASLLEQHRPNVFQMNVANIMPGDRVEVVLKYTELLVPEEGIYSFVYPTVVGPRYTESKGDETAFTKTPYTKEGILPAYDFDLKINLAGGMPVRGIESKTHKIEIMPESENVVNIGLAHSEKQPGNRDFILEYGFKGDKIETGLLLFDDGDEQFFLCMAQPPKRVTPQAIPSREYIFLLDVSGSMRGFPLDVSKGLMRNLIAELKPEDRFNIMVFAGGNQLWQEQSLPANGENLAAAVHFLNNLGGGGGTQLLPALERCLALPRHSEDLSRSIVVVTDGYISVEREAFELVRNNLDNSNLFAFGIGSSINRHLIEGLARAGQGTPFVVTDSEYAEETAEKFRKYIASPVMTQVKSNFKNFEAYDVEPQILPDVLSDRPVLLFGKYKGDGNGKIILEGYSGDVPDENSESYFKMVSNIFSSKKEGEIEKMKVKMDAGKVKADPRNVALKYLWAREKIRNLADFEGEVSDENREAVTALGLKYNLLTEFTSFIAVEETIANKDADNLKKVKQPLPLPQGVSNQAVGFDLSIAGVSGLEFFKNNRSSGSGSGWLIVVLILGFIAMFFIKKGNSLFALIFIGMVSIAGSGCGETASENQHNAVTFILGEDQTSKNQYYESALQYFSTDSIESTPLVVTNCKSLAAVREFLLKNSPTTGAWQHINLIAHGNEWTGLNVPIVPEGERCTQAALQTAMLQKIIKPLPNQTVNDRTRLHIVGCNVGKDTLLLKTISRAFGGSDTARPLVSAARYFNIFEKEKVEMNRHLAKSYFVSIPAGKFPGNRHVESLFKNKYGAEKMNWFKALLTLKPETPEMPYVHYFNIPATWTVVFPNEKERPILETEAEEWDWVNQQEIFMQQLENMDLQPDNFQWTTENLTFAAPNGQELPAIQISGQTIIYCILKPVIDENGAYLQTAMLDERFYTCVR